MTALRAAPLEVLDAYRTCEFVTLGRDGTPLAWPTAAQRRTDGTLVLTTSLAFAQKALNVRRDGRVALLFSDPTGSGLADGPQIFVRGRATCPDEIRTGPQGLESYWRMLFERQPHSRSYLARPMRRLMDWYYLRLVITVAPEQVLVRPAETPPLPPLPPRSTSVPQPLGAERLAAHATAVLAARDASGAPVLARTGTAPADGGFTVCPPADHAVVPGPASLLVHRHDDRLNRMRNTLVRGVLDRSDDGWLLVPDRVLEPMGAGRPSDALRVLRSTRRATDRYLRRRELPRPRVQWDRFREVAASAGRPERN
ncbi:pyridoxamine 5'-phosphate oxidase family protein [Streptomyces sp. VRA16 Mangrove soil]|uniref:pyridoxamine 5'-phosphate oxidase family protein n=1 Tax=Streptomyces sp. VRA16 Mangrove soil TaxID=2817434 RepID=UPI001A9F01E5|nr:pyridoxamine 5'-phosphate oxidase family protein [Streptomyces sp. VRA16 Mangrove soil]MBO1332181.1 pyridoxamine 5'-phosphate oxidase family protein [Streptomyces sp. VRA16 Mangrove soil]